MDDFDLLRILGDLGQPSVLIVGDLILDRYVTGDVGRISPEAPIPVLAGRRTEHRLGGAGNVAANLRAMGAQVELLGVVGNDADADCVTGLLEDIDIDASGLYRSARRRTTVKTRLISGGQQVLRLDWEEPHDLSSDAERAFLAGLDARLERASAVVLSDYGKGVLTEAVLRAVIDGAAARGVPVLVDPKGTGYERYRGATLVTPNKKEAEEALGRPIAVHRDGSLRGSGKRCEVDVDELARAAEELMERAQLAATLITLGADGIYYHAGPKLAHARGHVPASARAVFDVTGAGDTVIAQLALGLAAGLTLDEAVYLANHAASVAVGRHGAVALTRGDLRASLRDSHPTAGAVLAPDELAAQLEAWRAENKRIVFTNGCFDIIHAGHVTYLRTARARGDVLLVGVNDDASVRRLKGDGRPVNSIQDRLTVLAALEMVDAVVPFPEDTPLRIVQEVTPDVLVKGEDWADKGVVGREWVEEHGGEVFLAPLVAGRSTTSIVERLSGSR